MLLERAGLVGRTMWLGQCVVEDRVGDLGLVAAALGEVDDLSRRVVAGAAGDAVREVIPAAFALESLVASPAGRLHSKASFSRLRFGSGDHAVKNESEGH
jgi:hypothetical protein